MVRRVCLTLAVIALFCLSATYAHIFSNTFAEFHMDFGKSAEHYDGNHSAGIFTMTIEHYSNWAYGDNFFFIDVCSSRNFEFGTNDGSIYMEYAPRFSINKILGLEKWDGPIGDIYLTPQINYGYGSARWHGAGEVHGANVAHFEIGPVFLFGPSIDINIPGIQVLNFNFLYRYEFRSGNDPVDGQPVNDESGFQFTLVWGIKLAKLFEVEEKSTDPQKKPEVSKAGEVWFRGFLDIWDRGALHDDHATLLTEPQLLIYITNQLAIGSEVEISYNFEGANPGTKHFEVDPTFFVRFDF